MTAERTPLWGERGKNLPAVIGTYSLRDLPFLPDERAGRCEARVSGIAGATEGTGCDAPPIRPADSPKSPTSDWGRTLLR